MLWLLIHALSFVDAVSSKEAAHTIYTVKSVVRQQWFKPPTSQTRGTTLKPVSHWASSFFVYYCPFVYKLIVHLLEFEVMTSLASVNGIAALVNYLT